MRQIRGDNIMNISLTRKLQNKTKLYFPLSLSLRPQTQIFIQPKYIYILALHETHINFKFNIINKNECLSKLDISVQIPKAILSYKFSA